MSKAIKICKVCGREYEYCHTLRRVDGIFRWQDVACSPECGSEYLARIRASRAETHKYNNHTAEPRGNQKGNHDYNDLAEYENEDSWFDNDFDDDESVTVDSR